MKHRIAKARAALHSTPLFSMRDMFWQYAASFGVAIFGALFILAAGKMMGPANFGVYALAAAVPTVVNALFDYRIQEVSIVLLGEKVEPVIAARNVQSLLRFDIFSRMIAFALAVPIGIIVAKWFNYDISMIVALLAALVVFGAKAGNGIAIGVMRMSGNIQKYAILQSVDWAIRLAAFLVFGLATAPSIETAFLVQIPSAILINIVTVVLALRLARTLFGDSPVQPSIFRDLLHFFRRHSRFLLSSQSISAVDSVVKELDTLICGAFLPPQSVAAYKMAKSLAAVSWKCVDPIFVIILPNITNYASTGRMGDLSVILRKATTLLAVIGVIVFAAGWVVSYPFSSIALGAQYADIPIIFPWISIWIVIALPLIWTHSVAMATGHASLQAMAGLIGGIIGLAGLAIGASTGGLVGASFGLSIAFAAPFLVSFALLLRKRIISW